MGATSLFLLPLNVKNTLNNAVQCLQLVFLCYILISTPRYPCAHVITLWFGNDDTNILLTTTPWSLYSLSPWPFALGTAAPT